MSRNDVFSQVAYFSQDRIEGEGDEMNTNPESQSLIPDDSGASPMSSSAPPAEPLPRQAPEPSDGQITWERHRALESRHKSTTLAIVLSFLPGLGQIYTGYYQRGFIHALVFASIITMLANHPGNMAPLLGISLAFFWFYNIIDAGRRASFYNQIVDSRGAGLPEEIELPGTNGSFAGGIGLMAVGTLFLMDTKFNFDMYWVEEWWPLGLIILGAYLFFKNRMTRENS